MDLHEYGSHKLVSAEQAISNIRKGSRVFIGTGCGEPQHLIRAMVADMNMQDIMVYQMMSFTLADYIADDIFRRRFSLKLFFISRSMREAAFRGWIDYIPAYLSQIPRLFASHRIGLDVALIQVSPPDKYGYCSLGVSVDITRAGMENARLVIAQVNANMPRTWGDSFVHLDEIDYLVAQDEPIVEMPHRDYNPEIMGTNLRVKDTILHGETEGKTFYEIIQAGKAFGMITFDDYIIELYRDGKITDETAMAYASRKAIVGRGMDMVKAGRGEATTDIEHLEVDKQYAKKLKSGQ